MKIDYTKTGGVIRWGAEDWLHGLVPYFQDVQNSIIATGDGFSWSKGIDPYYMPGSIWPGTTPYTPTNTSVIDAILKNASTNGDQAYAVSGGAKIFNFSALTGAVTTPTTFPYTITHGGHSSVVGSDIISYYIGSTKYIFYSFNDATDADVGRYDLSTTFDDDYMSTVPGGAALLSSKTSPHPMVVGDDDVLYIADGNKLHNFDGQNGGNGTLDARTPLTLPLGSIITSFAKTQNFLVVYAYRPSITSGAYYKSDVKAYFWDYVSEDPTYKYVINGNYINGGFNFKGAPGCFVRGLDANFKTQKGSRLMLFNGTEFVPVMSFAEAIPGHGGVEAMENVIRWNADAVMYQYGSLHGFPNSINRLSQGSGFSSEGMFKNLALNIFWMSSGTSTTGGLQGFGGTPTGGFYNDAVLTMPQVFPAFPSDYKGRLTKIRVHWKNKMESSGSTAKFNIWYDASQNQLVFDNSLATTTNLIDEYHYAYPTSSSTVINFPLFSNITWRLTYNGGTVTSVPDVIQGVELFYENSKI